MWDVFISHASEDKSLVARPLAEKLKERGLEVWYDDYALTIGDSLRRSIDDGLLKSKFGIVILSHSFFSKEWPQTELDGLAAKRGSGKKVILPIWHEITRDEVFRYSPTLADTVAVSTSKGLDVVVDQLLRVLRPDDRKSSSQLPVLRFRNEIWPEPVSIKAAMEALAQGATGVQVDWPKSTLFLIEQLSSVISEIENYTSTASRFHHLEPDLAAYIYELGIHALQYAERMQKNVPARISVIRKEMKEYWGDIPNARYEKVLFHFMAYANLSIQLRIATSSYKPAMKDGEQLPVHLQECLKYDRPELHRLYAYLFHDDAAYAADVESISDVYFNRYFYGPKSQLIEAYFDYHLHNKPILNHWFVEQVIPQAELMLAESDGTVDKIVNYCEEARINKIRDEAFEEVRFREE